MRAWLLGLVVLAASCRCGIGGPVNTDGELRVSASELDFGRVALGAAHTLELELFNAGRSPLDVTMSVAAPFSLSVQQLRLAGGGAQTIHVTFTPTSVGPVSALLDGVPVELFAEGIAACVPSTCHTTAFDLATRACLEQPLDDASACTSTCLLGAGTCRRGECVGTASVVCDDNNPCTIDGCAVDGGCLHVEFTPPVRSPCEVAACNPDAGVVYQPVEDGTRCAPARCAEQFVCINGACASRPTANASDDCRYTGVCSNRASGNNIITCASTRSRKLRCWGQPLLLGRDGGFSGPDFIPDATDVEQPVCVELKPRWLDSQRALQPDAPLAAHGYTQLRALSNDVEQPSNGVSPWRALTVDGQQVRISGSTLLGVVDGGVRALCGSRHFIRDDGLVYATRAPETPLFSRQVQACAGRYFDSLFLFDDNSVRLESGALLVDAGATAVGSGWNADVIFFGAEARFPAAGARLAPAWPFVPSRVTDDGRGVLCGVSDAGELACADAVPGTSLSSYPDLPLEFGDGGFTWVRAGSFIDGSESVQALDRRGGGWSSGPLDRAPRDAGASTLSRIAFGGVGHLEATSPTCVLRDSTRFCLLADAGTHVTPDVVSLAGAYNTEAAVTSRGALVAPDGRVLQTDVLPGSNAYCFFPIEGGVVCGASRHALPGPPRIGSAFEAGGCVIDSSFQAWCFEGATPPQNMNLSLVRLVSGNLRRGCAVVGANGVRCWGLDRRFRQVAIGAPITRLSVDEDQQSINACVVTEAGRVFCWGKNEYGGLGVAPYDGTFIVPVVE